MTTSRTPWPGIGCGSPMWPYTSTPAGFEVRRAVVELLRNRGEEDPRPGTPALAALSAINEIAAQVDQVRREVIAEARTEGVPWSDIGEALGVGTTAAQKRYGTGLPPERLEELAAERDVAELVVDLVAGDDAEADQESLSDAFSELQYTIRKFLSCGMRMREALDTAPADRTGRVGELIEHSLSDLSMAVSVMSGGKPWHLAGKLGKLAQRSDCATYSTGGTYVYYAFFLALLAWRHCTPPEHEFHPPNRDLSGRVMDCLNHGLRALIRKDSGIVIQLVHATVERPDLMRVEWHPEVGLRLVVPVDGTGGPPGRASSGPGHAPAAGA
ncbi:hypothetical protein Q5530_19910 [Saccharothrix sp. BKS2]|uniref:hypothetical protein n=1 Tax=Saccharothrix sp. BKS2 TaxID=3064400 RepID=UPI0039ECC331